MPLNKVLKYSIGLMSGTSLDGVDLVYVEFGSGGAFKIRAANTYKYNDYWYDQLCRVSELKRGAVELEQLDVELGKYFAELIRLFIKDFSISKVDFVASHGHTVHHRPDIGYTLQIGAGEVIANELGIMTVCDFRTQDVYMGGQGAPLVPIGDRDLFSAYEFCVNLGGFSNVSYQKDGVTVAFDICPVNTVLNYYARKIGKEYDAGGNLASQGEVSEVLLEALNSLDYYTQLPPKSLGVEFVNEIVLPLITSYRLEVVDVLATMVEHIAIQVSKVVNFNNALFTGGGVYNNCLMKRIEMYSKSNICIPNHQIVDFKEALVFAYLGKLKLEGSVNCLSSVTGANRNHSSGKVFSIG